MQSIVTNSSLSTLGDIQPSSNGTQLPSPSPEKNIEQEEVLLEPCNEDTTKSAEQFYLEKNNSMKVLVAYWSRQWKWWKVWRNGGT